MRRDIPDPSIYTAEPMKELLAALGIGGSAKAPSTSATFYRPYAEEHVNFLYNLLFCDDVSLFERGGQNCSGPLASLLADQPDSASLRAIADDVTNEGRVRALAYNQLRAAGEEVPQKKALGIIVEVPLERGLDVLAAFCEGGVRYLNQSGKVVVFEGQGNPVEDLAKELVGLAQHVVDQLGPWDKPRLPPPRGDTVRLSFLVSDGLYFGQGPYGFMSQDGRAGPLLAKATQLLQRATDLASK